jgi:ABC-2 type transport system permease protein
MSAIYMLWLREVRRYLRSRAQVVTSLSQPALYLFALGFGMNAVFHEAGRGSYVQFVTPGIIAMSVLFSTSFSGVGLLWDRQFGVLKSTLVAPVPRFYIMLGRTLGSATVAFLQSALVIVACLVAGFRPARLDLLPVAAGFVALLAMVFASLGTLFGTTLKEMQTFQVVMNFLIMPLFFLSGALYPIDNLPSAMNVLVQLDPLAYGVDGLRALLLQQSHFGAALDALVLIVLAIVLTWVGAWRFSKVVA